MIFNKKWALILIFFWGQTIITYQKRPLNILFVVEYFPSSSQIYILNIITSLLDRGHNISIFSFTNNTENAGSLHPKIEQYDLLNRVTYGEFPEKLPECDIVFCQFGNLGQKILEMDHLSAWLQKKKLVVCFRGFDLAGYVNNPSEVNEQLFDRIDLFLPVCDYFKKRLAALGCPEGKVIVHHSGIDCSQFFFKPRRIAHKSRIHLVSVGRFVKKKGIMYALQAFALVVKKYKNAHFTIIGDGPERANFEALIRKLNLKSKVTLCGWKTQKEIVSILNKSHIFLLPSITRTNGNEEGIPNALKEAMAMGLISIATWHAGIPELIDNGISGFLVAEKDSNSLAGAIKHVITHSQQWKSIGVFARKKIEQEFESKKLAQELEEIFYKLLKIA